MGFQFASKSKQTAQHKSSPSLRRTRISLAPPHPVLQLQRTIGNQGVLRLLESQKIQQAGPLADTHQAQGQRADIRQTLHGQRLQPKLTIGEPNDQYEQEADRVADQMMRTPEPQLQRACACGGRCPKCQAEQLGQEHERLQTKRVQASDTGQIAAPPIVSEGLRSPGQPLDSATKAYFEPRFGHDLSHVRVHTDPKASESARAVSALAYTVGQDVVFRTGQFTPCTTKGRRLLAHELAHTIQQGNDKSDRLSRVPTESGIRDERYNFSTNCGWIDWSHADPGIGADLISRVQQASVALRAAGTSTTSSTGEFTSTTMASHVPVVGIVLSSAALRVRLLRPLSADEVLSVALSIFKKLSVVFETQQQWTQLVGRSSFSQEDLPSNLIGFYQAARSYSINQINQYCGTLDESDSLQEFNRDHAFETNRSFLPVGITGHWPPELSNINDSEAPLLYEILTISATQGMTSFRFCPIYRVEGQIGETDLLIVSVGGAQFTAADNLRVVPTYRAREGTHGLYGHVTFIEVEPNGQSDYGMMRQRGISWPIWVPEPVLVCLSSHGNPV
ncbi:MAG: DUF4157 domain-containing protein [Phycisphaerales bacterium]